MDTSPTTFVPECLHNIKQYLNHLFNTALPFSPLHLLLERQKVNSRNQQTSKKQQHNNNRCYMKTHLSNTATSYDCIRWHFSIISFVLTCLILVYIYIYGKRYGRYYVTSYVYKSAKTSNIKLLHRQ